MEWVSVDERLPELGDCSVLAYFDDYDGIDIVHVEDYFSNITAGIKDGKQLYTKRYITQRVTHWMPLPKLPNS